ncbi:MAG: 3-carboxy-cis,cis-muconate cycloisomerase [Actinobacteria bacterium]|nr:3-carboxy-cis,cis-muconate cycloisomerase [Actinomycetota bacterium]
MFSSPSEVGARTGDGAWLEAMLDFEAALAGALADVGLADAAVADEIAAVCAAGDLAAATGPDRPGGGDAGGGSAPGSTPGGWDLDALGAGTARDGTPIPALLAQLRPRLSAAARAVLHRGATSQDVVDTAAMLVARRALVPLLADLDAAADAAAGLADRHRDDLAAGRTLLQQALPITFGMRAANWLGGLDDAVARLTAIRDERLAIQLGGAAGSLASLGGHGIAVAEALARRLGLPAPPVPWQTNRSRVVELAAAIGQAAGAAGKVGTDVVLLAQTEVGEVAEGGGGGGSSTLPHKRNPTAAVTAVAVARRTPGLVATLLAAMSAEEERAAGAWQAEAETLDELLGLAGQGVAAVRALLEGLEVFPDRMRANLDLTDGLIMSESLASALAAELGRARAQELVGEAARVAVAADASARRVADASASTEAARRAVAAGASSRSAGSAGGSAAGASAGSAAASFAAAAAESPEIVAALGTAGIVAALDPSAYLGATGALIDRALAAHRARVGATPR